MGGWRKRGKEQEKEGRKERVDYISQPALQLSQLCLDRGKKEEVLVGWNLQQKSLKATI